MNIKTPFNLYNILRNQWLPSSQLLAIQNLRLKRIIRHAYNNVPYYRKLFNSAGIFPEEIQGVEDLYRIPITTKSQLQSLDIKEIITKGTKTRKCMRITTSGEDGIPFALCLNSEELDYWRLLLLRFLAANGAKFTDKFLALAYPARFPEKKKWFQYLGMLRHIYISAFDNPREYTDKIIKVNPDIIIGYAGALRLFAEELKRRGNVHIKPRLIFSSAEMLDDETRCIIRKVFGIEVMDLYSVIETGPIAWECQHHEGYHINIDSVVIECLKNGRNAAPGEEGKVICTNLFNFTMPIIRYSIDDVVVFSEKKCSCGRDLPLLEKFEGRLLDFITLPDGRVISPAVITCILRKSVGSAQYRLIQQDKGRLIIQLVPGKDFQQETIYSLKNNICKEFGSDIDLEVKIVKEIERGKSGKQRKIISHVAVEV